jgi:hypothetical protein
MDETLYRWAALPLISLRIITNLYTNNLKIYLSDLDASVVFPVMCQRFHDRQYSLVYTVPRRQRLLCTVHLVQFEVEIFEQSNIIPVSKLEEFNIWKAYNFRDFLCFLYPRDHNPGSVRRFPAVTKRRPFHWILYSTTWPGINIHP